MQEKLTAPDKSAAPRQKVGGPDYDGHNMIFVVGSPRSGTTWLQRLLAAHPQIRSGQESHVFSYHIGPQLQAWAKLGNPRNRGGVGMACYFTKERFSEILKEYLKALLEPMVAPLGPGELFLEKTPGHALFLREIFELLPKARVLHMLRDARDVVSSLLAQDEWLSNWAPRNAPAAAAMWVGHVRAVREAVSELGPGRFHEIRYEELSRSPALTLRQCADFLGLKWEDAEIANALEMNQAAKARAKGGGTPIPLFGDVAERSGPTVIEPKGFVRRGKPGGWREDLSLYQQFRAWRIAHQEMEAVGYHWDKPRRLIFASVSALADLMKGRRMLPAARSLALGYFAALVQFPSICDMFDLLS